MNKNIFFEQNEFDGRLLIFSHDLKYFFIAANDHAFIFR